jgi:hypothetical protein
LRVPFDGIGIFRIVVLEPVTQNLETLAVVQRRLGLDRVIAA